MLILVLFRASGEKGTLTHGSVVDGRFEGFIKTHQGTYYVEPSERYLKNTNVPFHSVIYHEDDISKYLTVEILHVQIIFTLDTRFLLDVFLCTVFPTIYIGVQKPVLVNIRMIQAGTV